MAIDTASRRLSSLSVGQVFITGLIPDGTISAEDRQNLAFNYNGITASAVSPPVFSGILSDLQIVANREKTVDYSGHFSNATSYSISPTVESGWSFNTSTGVLTILEAGVSQYGAYTITGINAGGSSSSNAFYIQVISGSAGGSYARPSRTLRPISDYEEEIKLILAQEKKEALKEKKSLKAKAKRLEVLSEKPKIRQEQETRLKLVSKSLLQIEMDLAEITEKRANIALKARILRDDDEVIMLLMSEGYL